MSLRDLVVVHVASALHSLTYYYPGPNKPFFVDPRSLLNKDIERVRLEAHAWQSGAGRKRGDSGNRSATPV